MKEGGERERMRERKGGEREREACSKRERAGVGPGFSLRFLRCSDSAHFGNGEPRPPKDGNGHFSTPPPSHTHAHFIYKLSQALTSGEGWRRNTARSFSNLLDGRDRERSFNGSAGRGQRASEAGRKTFLSRHSPKFYLRSNIDSLRRVYSLISV